MGCDGCFGWLVKVEGCGPFGDNLRGMPCQLSNCVHPPGPLTLCEGGRFLAALGMTWGWLCRGVSRNAPTPRVDGDARMLRWLWMREGVDLLFASSFFHYPHGRTVGPDPARFFDFFVFRK